MFIYLAYLASHLPPIDWYFLTVEMLLLVGLVSMTIVLVQVAWEWARRWLSTGERQ